MKVFFSALGLVLIPLLTAFLLFSPVPAGAKMNPPPGCPDKVFVTDGHVRHDVGDLHNHVSNFGLIGSAPSVPTTFGHAPSGRWRGASGTNYLWAAGLWIGGVRLGERVVSTGGWASELYPSEAAEDSIYSTFHGENGGNRFPWPLADDDDDGLEDEDPLNGLDDDGDGSIDEDFAAIGLQAHRCVYRDDTELVQETYPDHVPMNLAIIQESYQWDSPLLTNAIAYEFTITNVGVVAVDDVYLGMFSDFDVNIAEDDLAGFWQGEVLDSNGDPQMVAFNYMWDADDYYPIPGVQGWVLLGHPTDPAGIAAPSEIAVVGYRDWQGNVPFEQGGDPTNDDERYQVLSTSQIDGPAIHPNDHRVMVSSGPFLSLPPGGSLKYQMALVAGEDLEDLKINAAEMVSCYRGREFERDGQLVRVHWIPPTQEIVAAASGSVAALVVDQGLQLTIETNQGADDGLALIRHSSGQLPGRIWLGADLLVEGSGEFGRRYRVMDNDAGSGVRNYDLVLLMGGTTLVLDRSEIDLPEARGQLLAASPNPFNPQLSIQYLNRAEGPVRLQVYDIRGQWVRTLVDEVRPQGANSLIWDGRDDGGRSVASGVYQLRLENQGQLVEKRVTLVK